MYLKKLFLFSTLSTALCGSYLLATGLTKNPEINSEFLEKVYKATQNIKNISLKDSIDSNVSSSRAPFVYSIFSTNLHSFSRHFRDSFHSWYLFQWANFLLSSTSRDSFPEAKSKIYNHLLSHRNSYSSANIAQPTPKNWLKNNHLIDSSKNILKSTFDDIFFKKLHLGDDGNGNKEFALDQAQKEPYGDDDFMDAVVDFQKRLFEFWLKNEQPRLYCRRSWSHSSSFGSSHPYKTDGTLDLPPSPDFRFPDFHESAEEIKSYLKGEMTCRNEDLSLHTLTDLSKLDDGHELSGFLHRHKPEWSPDSKLMRNKSEFQNISNPLEIFLKESISGDEEHSQWKMNAEIINENGPLKDKVNKILLNLVDVKGSQDKYITFLRTKSGLLSLQRKSEQNSEEEIKKALLKFDSSKLKERLKDYFHSHSLEFLGEQLKEGDSSDVFLEDDFSKSLKELLVSLSEYLLLTEKNQMHGKFLEILSSASAQFLDTKFSDSKPDKSTGLATPIQLPRNLNKEDEIEQFEFSNFSSSETNDGNFIVLSEIFKNRKIPRLPHKTLKDNIHQYINSLNVFRTEGSKTSHFFNDYLLDNVLHEFLKNEGHLKNLTLSILLINELDFKIGDSILPKSFVESLGLSENLVPAIEEEIVEIFLANRYFKEKIENRLNYGGFKHDKNCLRAINPTPPSNFSNSCTSRSQLNIKLKNYWLMKNHYFNQHAYELGSGPMFEYMKFLHTFSSLIKNDFSEFRRRASSKITSGRFGALVWANGALHDSKSQTKLGESSTTAGITSLKDESKYFKDSRSSEIFNPFFSRKIKLNNHTGPSNLSSESLSAYANGKELFGFLGFHAQKPKEEEDDLSHVWEAIFEKFPNSNPQDNKNYGEEVPVADISLGSAYGYSHGFESIEQILDSFKKRSTLESFLKTFFRTDYLEINKRRTPGLEDLRTAAKEHLLKEDFSKKFKRATSRFSGFLQNPNREHSILSDQKYLIQRNSSSNEGHIVRIIQINKYDLGDGFQDLVNVVGFRTLLKTLILMVENDEEMVNGIVNLLL